MDIKNRSRFILNSFTKALARSIRDVEHLRKCFHVGRDENRFRGQVAGQVLTFPAPVVSVDANRAAPLGGRKRMRLKDCPQGVGPAIELLGVEFRAFATRSDAVMAHDVCAEFPGQTRAYRGHEIRVLIRQGFEHADIALKAFKRGTFVDAPSATSSKPHERTRRKF